MKLKLKIRFRHGDYEHEFLESIYLEYLKKVIKKDIFPQSRHGFWDGVNRGENIFLKFRDKYNGQISAKDEEYLISKLNSRIGKWFVPFVLSVVDQFSEKMMHELLETAIKVRDPSYNSSFINPAVRVYRFQEYEYLIDRFNDSNFDEKMGLLRAFYWVGEGKIWRRETHDVETDYRAKYKWNERGYYKSDYNITEEERIRFRAEIKRLHTRKIETFLDQYCETKNDKIKYYLARELPTSIDEFPSELKIKANLYLEKLVEVQNE